MEELKERVCAQNLALVKHGLVVLTWGNVSAIDREKGLVVIKPSGVSYDTMKPEDMVVVDLDGKVVYGKYRPSSDTPTHLYLYKTFPDVGGIVHTHSTYATAWAQAGRSIPAFGTTHADAFYGKVPCARALTKEEVENEYELNTGKVIAQTFADKDYNAIPAVLVKNHGPFTWGATPEKAVENAVTLEAVAKMAIETERINAGAGEVDKYLLDKHYFRKHGKNAYYGQK
ncbi:MAG: L-ribulose-5-phosphate 4-epimerase [Clostridiales bacterium]|nr:L-ribulose-5-phosphate 4-epimerase [Clostridiales bacterium]